jgi:hypothetical protein
VVCHSPPVNSLVRGRITADASTSS